MDKCTKCGQEKSYVFGQMYLCGCDEKCVRIKHGPSQHWSGRAVRTLDDFDAQVSFKNEVYGFDGWSSDRLHTVVAGGHLYDRLPTYAGNGKLKWYKFRIPERWSLKKCPNVSYLATGICTLDSHGHPDRLVHSTGPLTDEEINVLLAA